MKRFFLALSLMVALLMVMVSVTTISAQEPEATPVPEEDVGDTGANSSNPPLYLPLITKSPGNVDLSEAALSETARQLIAERTGIPMNQLAIAEQTSSHLPLTNVNLADFKVVSSDGRIFTVSFDTATGQVVDAESAAQQEQQARTATYGILEPALYNHMQRNAAARIPVAIWVVMPDPGNLGRGNNPNFNLLAVRTRTAQAPVASATTALGGVVSQADLVPVIFAELTAGQINALAHHPNVAAIEEVPRNLTRLNDDSATSDRYPFIWSSANGSGAMVAVHEDDGVDTVNTFLINPPYWCTGVGTGPGGANCTIGK